MDLDELMPRRNADDPLAALRREDLDRLSLDELKQRISVLEAEIDRTRAKLDSASTFRSAADALFKR
ncbi:MAG TPA: DUF1192 domain-containing protein [Pedomonas sp.]|uniref:DUF1192 domain-containing protein n=1 Tax=Pedomonas sp. TaxID=2976421 RepID=UPI002F3F61AB